MNDPLKVKVMRDIKNLNTKQTQRSSHATNLSINSDVNFHLDSIKFDTVAAYYDYANKSLIEF